MKPAKYKMASVTLYHPVVNRCLPAGSPGPPEGDGEDRDGGPKRSADLRHHGPAPPAHPVEKEQSVS